MERALPKAGETWLHLKINAMKSLPVPSSIQKHGNSTASIKHFMAMAASTAAPSTCS